MSAFRTSARATLETPESEYLAKTDRYGQRHTAPYGRGSERRLLSRDQHFDLVPGTRLIGW